jgi:hypothetical protein
MAGGSQVASELTSWDGAWLLTIAEHGYDGVPAGMLDAFGHHSPDTALGFFPGYPALVAAVGVLTGGSVVVAGPLVPAAARVAAAYGLMWSTHGLMNAKLRLLLPAFVLLLPVASGLAKRRTDTAAAVGRPRRSPRPGSAATP